jgi:asparagine synthase (glutamine-hydrolysing)
MTAVVDRMLDRMAARGGDQRAVRTTGEGLCIGADVRWTTPEASSDVQPLVLPESRAWLALDGRLDNRDDVIARLGATAGDSDAALIGQWLVRSSADPAALIGDFALALWRPHDQRLVLMRDGVGVRPLYFAETPDVIWFASSLAAMIVPEWYRPTPNEGFLAEYLASAPANLDETAWTGIRRLPQGHALEITPTSVTRRAYWALEAQGEREISEQAAVEEFRALFDTAVHARLRSRMPVAFQLSGGLDSSTVVGVAHALGVESPSTYSLVYPDVPSADESRFIDAVVSRCGARSVRHPIRTWPAVGFHVFDAATQAADLADGPTGEWSLAPLLRRTREDGHGVMLTGCGGDEWLTGSLYRIPALIREGRLGDAWRYAAEYRSIDWLDPGAKSALRTTVVAFMPEGVKNLFRTMRAGPVTPPWITSSLAQRVNLDERMRAAFRRVPGVAHPVVRESLARLTSGDAAFVRDALDRMAVPAGLELRHPFFDRRVVEFLVSLPDHFRLRHGTHRYLTRRTYADVLPDIVRTRMDKPDIDHVVLDALRAVDPDAWLDDLEVVSRGWVDLDVTKDLWRRANRSRETHHPDDVTAPLVLWQIFAVEAWLRAVFSTPGHVSDARRTPPLSV